MKMKMMVGVVLAGLSAFGADGTWIADISGNWSDSTKWLNGIIANGDDSTAVMPLGRTVTPDQAVSLNRLQIKAYARATGQCNT